MADVEFRRCRVRKNMRPILEVPNAFRKDSERTTSLRETCGVSP